MWTFNVVRELFYKSGFNIEPKTIPQKNNEFLDLFNKNINNKDPKKIFVYKIHKILKSNLPNSKIITTIRDPREIIVSFMRFMKFDFNKGFLAAKDIIKYNQIYKSYSSDLVLFLKYEEILKNPFKVIKQILEFIKLNLDDNKIKKIIQKFEKNNNIKLIKNNDNILNKKLRNKKNIDPRKIVYLSENNFRSFDINTGFQTGHISDMTKKDYRNYLTAEQMDKIKNFFSDWLKNNGYSNNY